MPAVAPTVATLSGPPVPWPAPPPRHAPVPPPGAVTPLTGPPVQVADPAAQAGPIRLGELTIDAAGHLVTWRGEPLALTRLERAVLAVLASPPLAVWTYERLFGSVWGGAYLGDTAILHSAMKRLRRKLRATDDDLRVQTVRGVGYRLAVPN
uniref:winged helix-turn-helix domain-containing protein n=1 Tax=Polymorphospora lycopeni TaxID=3140240 RepID=UPI0035D4EA77